MRLTVADAYVGAGVARRVRAPGLMAELEPFRLRLSGMALEGTSTLVGEVVGERGSAPRPLPLRGRYDVATGEARFDGGPATLTSDEVEFVVQFSFRLEDGSPQDGVASELVGSVTTSTRVETADARWVGVEERSEPIPVPDPARMRAGPSPRGGQILLEGEAGAAAGGAGIQVLRYTPELEVPEVSSAPVRFSGAFILELPGEPGDVLLVRARTERGHSDAVTVTVDED